MEDDLNECHSGDPSVKQDEAVEGNIKKVDEWVLVVGCDDDRDEVGDSDGATAMCYGDQESVGVAGVRQVPESQEDIDAQYHGQEETLHSRGQSTEDELAFEGGHVCSSLEAEKRSVQQMTLDER